MKAVVLRITNTAHSENLMANDWQFTRNRTRQGSVSFERLQKLAAEGWLLPTDPVRPAGMTDWALAGQMKGLFGSRESLLLQRTFVGKDFIDPKDAQTVPRQSRVPELPPPPEKLSRRRARQAKATQVHIAWEQWRPRRVIAAMGGFLAALGIAFTVIDQSRVAVAFTITGLCIVAAVLQRRGVVLPGDVRVRRTGHPVLILHFLCVLGALSGDPWTEGKTTVARQ